MSRVIDTGAVFRRAHQAWYEQITERHTLDFGVAFTCPTYPRLAEGNQVREVVLTGRVPIDAAYEQAEAYYASNDVTCLGWAPAGGQDPDVLEAFLNGVGFRRHAVRAMLLGDWPSLATDDAVRILPARAARAAYFEVCREAGAGAADFAEAMNDRIDDPNLDMSVALLDGEPVGMMDLFQIGDIGFVKTAYVRPAFRRRGIGTTLLAHVLRLAQRLAPRYVGAEARDAATAAFLERAGFQPGPEQVTFRRDAAL